MQLAAIPWGLILKVISIGKVLRHLPTIMSLFKLLSAVFKALKDNDGTADDKFKLVLDEVETLLRAGVIDLPDVDETKIADMVKQFKDWFYAPN